MAYLVHHGIKGQKWGVRRYQNEDGTLTTAGKERYGSDGDDSMAKKRGMSEKTKKTLKKVAIAMGAVAATTVAAAVASNLIRRKAMSFVEKDSAARISDIRRKYSSEGWEGFARLEAVWKEQRQGERKSDAVRTSTREAIKYLRSRRA